jgi:porphobilinogen synthase
MSFPTHRLRRLRQHPRLRAMIQEARLGLDALIEPFFVAPGRRRRREIPSMPGQHQLSIDELLRECEASAKLGLGAAILFGIPEHKDALGSEGYARGGITARAIRAVKKAFPDLLLAADVCLCEYTSHGHCGVVRGRELLNDPTLKLLAKEAVTYAEAGADVVAPSAMADGQVAAIRAALDRAGFPELPILSYSAKYASAFYGPFRDAAASAPAFGDRSCHQMDPACARQALREVELDLEEGADMVMVKPALAYLDIIHQVKSLVRAPVAAYNVSGEYSLVKAAAAKGWIDGDRVAREMLTAIRRAGADVIITYFARDAARWLSRG